jgi:glycolate oxidase FAD binding subunit
MDGWRAIEALTPLGGEAFQDWAGGLIWLALDAAHAREVRAIIAPFGGHATLIRGEGPTFHPEPPALAALTARVKAAFDPNGVLNPRHRLGQG